MSARKVKILSIDSLMYDPVGGGPSILRLSQVYVHLKCLKAYGSELIIVS